MSGSTFEALNYALRKSRDGVIVSFVIHPNDVTPELMSLPIGARVAVKWAALTDDEKHIPSDEEPPSSPFATDASTAAPQGGEGTAATSKSKRRFSDLPLSQQCAMRCNDKTFREWLGVADEHAADRWIKIHCGMKSKTELDSSDNAEARGQWAITERAFMNYLATLQHQDLVR